MHNIYIASVVLFAAICAANPTGHTKRDELSDLPSKDVYNEVLEILKSSANGPSHAGNGDRDNIRHRQHKLKAAGALVKQGPAARKHIKKQSKPIDSDTAHDGVTVKNVLAKRRIIAANQPSKEKISNNKAHSKKTGGKKGYIAKHSEEYQQTEPFSVNPSSSQYTNPYPDYNTYSNYIQETPYTPNTYNSYIQSPSYNPNTYSNYIQSQSYTPNTYSNHIASPSYNPNTYSNYFQSMAYSPNIYSSYLQSPSFSPVVSLPPVNPPTLSWTMSIEYEGMDPIYISDTNYTDNAAVEVVVHPAPVPLPPSTANELLYHVSEERRGVPVDKHGVSPVTWSNGVQYFPVATSTYYVPPISYPVAQWPYWPSSWQSVPVYSPPRPDSVGPVPYVPIVPASGVPSKPTLPDKDLVAINITPFMPTKKPKQETTTQKVTTGIPKVDLVPVVNGKDKVVTAAPVDVDEDEDTGKDVTTAAPVDGDDYDDEDSDEHTDEVTDATTEDGDVKVDTDSKGDENIGGEDVDGEGDGDDDDTGDDDDDANEDGSDYGDNDENDDTEEKVSSEVEKEVEKSDKPKEETVTKKPFGWGWRG